MSVFSFLSVSFYRWRKFETVIQHLFTVGGLVTVSE